MQLWLQTFREKSNYVIYFTVLFAVNLQPKDDLLKLTETMKVSFLSSDKSTTSSWYRKKKRAECHSEAQTRPLSKWRNALLVITHITLVGHQVQQAFLDSQQVGGGSHHYIDQDLRDNGDEGVLPGEGVQEGCDCMNDLG